MFRNPRPAIWVALASYLTLSLAAALFHDHGTCHSEECSDHQTALVGVHCHDSDHRCSHASEPDRPSDDGPRQPRHDEDCPACQFLGLQPLCVSVVAIPQTELAQTRYRFPGSEVVTCRRRPLPPSRGPPIA
ncbi:MAG: DUF2946 family protein [Rhodopirellula sp.]|nr:DUF2946 family protein [Rhodopirellula sp.]